MCICQEGESASVLNTTLHHEQRLPKLSLREIEHTALLRCETAKHSSDSNVAQCFWPLASTPALFFVHRREET